MDKFSSQSQLKKTYIDILNGYSCIDRGGNGRGALYIKHLSIFESQEIDEINDFYKKKFIKEGMPTLEEKEKDLEKDKLWTKKERGRIQELTLYLKNLEATKSKLVLKSQIDLISLDARKSELELEKLLSERAELVGSTAESFADKKANDHYLMISLYSDPQLSKKKFTPEEFDEISEEELAQVSSSYSLLLNSFTPKNLKKISLSPFFVNSFCMVEDNPYQFYGKPMTELTFYQTDILLYGKYFRSLLSDMKNKPSQDVMDDPDKLIEYFNISKNTSKLMDKKTKEGSATTIVGATSEDLKAMGLKSGGANDNQIDLSKAAGKKGGALGMEDLLKLHGV